MIWMIAREDGTAENVRHKNLVAVQSPDHCMAEQAAEKLGVVSGHDFSRAVND
jgi:hypothetical protein